MNDPTDERSRRVDTIRALCERSALDVGHEPLSDRAALLIALGRVDADARTVAVSRLQSSKRYPTLGGFGRLRLASEELRWIDGKLAGLRQGPTRFALTQRRLILDRRLGALESEFVMSGRHYAHGIRAIRRERREGVHIDLEQRTALFRALCRTPTPLGTGPGPVDRAREVVLGAAADRLQDSGRIADLARSVAGTDVDRFADRYDTVLFLAGWYYDLLADSRMWRSEVFAIARAQLDVGVELMQIAIDVDALAHIDSELDAAFAEGDASDDVGRREVLLRKGDLIPVWDQIIERVAELSRLVDRVGEAQIEHRTLDALHRTVNLDPKIEELISRSGTRELSADNIRNVGEQISRDRQD